VTATSGAVNLSWTPAPTPNGFTWSWGCHVEAASWGWSPLLTPTRNSSGDAQQVLADPLRGSPHGPPWSLSESLHSPPSTCLSSLDAFRISSGRPAITRITADHASVSTEGRINQFSTNCVRRMTSQRSASVEHAFAKKTMSVRMHAPK
jgi:hypothetical protein